MGKLNSSARLDWTVLDFKETANSAHFHYYLPNNLESCQNCAQVLSHSLYEPAGGSPAQQERVPQCFTAMPRRKIIVTTFLCNLRKEPPLSFIRRATLQQIFVPMRKTEFFNFHIIARHGICQK